MPPPQVPQASTDAHKIWHTFDDTVLPLKVYLQLIDSHYAHLGVICGPDDWFVSCVEAYKRDDGVRHELLFIAAKRTPRLPSVPRNGSSLEDNQADDLVEANLIVDRRVENNEAGKGKSASRGAENSKNDQDYRNEGNGSSGSLSDSLLLGSNTTVKWVYGRRRARDTARMVQNQKEKALKGYERLGYMNFPTPPVLPADNDFRAALNLLENPPAQPAPDSPRFVSLPTLISLASFISGRYPDYTPTDKNCYWFCAMVIHMLRRYARADFFLVNKQNNVTIRPEDLRAVIDKKVKEAKSAIGTCSFLTITAIPGDKRVGYEVDKWQAQEEERMNKLQATRLTELTELTRMKEVGDKLEEERQRRIRLESAMVGETKKRQAETKRKLDEQKKRKEETKKKLNAMKKAGEEMKKAEAERQKAEAERQRAEEERKRADETARELAKRDGEIAELRRQLALKNDR